MFPLILNQGFSTGKDGDCASCYGPRERIKVWVVRHQVLSPSDHLCEMVGSSHPSKQLNYIAYRAPYQFGGVQRFGEREAEKRTWRGECGPGSQELPTRSRALP